jgi:hypothetical protein
MTANTLILARDALTQLIACHDEPTCPALDVARQALAAIEAEDASMRANRLAARAQVAQGDEVDAWAELCRRVYVELFYCDQQMTSGRKKWQQGPSVRDALHDAKAALESRDAARALQGGQP